MEKYDLRSMDLAEMTELMGQLRQPAFRAKQLFGWVHEKQAAQLGQMHNLGKALLAQLEAQCCPPCSWSGGSVHRMAQKSFCSAWQTVII